jgi:hypothetical protein
LGERHTLERERKEKIQHVQGNLVNIELAEDFAKLASRAVIGIHVTEIYFATIDF